MADLAASHVRKLVLEKAEGMRIAGDAVPIASQIAADFIRKLGERAATIARANHRKTIFKEDLEQARAQIWMG